MEDKLENIKVFSKNIGVSQQVLISLIKRGLLKSVNKNNTHYLSKTLFNDYINNFTFDGYLLSKFNKKQGANVKSNPEKIVDIEDEIISNWQNEYNKIYHSYLARESHDFVEGIKRLKKENKYTRKLPIPTSKIFSSKLSVAFIVLVAVMNLSFYSLILFPEKSFNTIARIDKIFAVPEQKLASTIDNIFADYNQAYCLIEDKILSQFVNNKDIKSDFIKNNSASLAQSEGSRLITVNDMLNKNNNKAYVNVAGVEHSFSEKENFSISSSIKEVTELYKNFIKNKHKEISDKINNKIDNWLE